ncbi:radical SAM protein [Thauera aromatica]|uniref:radical SAM protein n=1 Tax=Thauera aromatica TaxID=59405 RepID=UPI001FFD2DFF|nr:radical SAM protein [Thauera aromatica]MCK2097042.1 radical SAM protein [Thauera aromatica]
MKPPPLERPPPSGRYRIAVNAEWTSKCNALCPMCPRELIEHPQRMSRQTWQQTLARLTPEQVFRTVIAGYGEATTHRHFFDFVDDLRGHPVRFDMVSNGHLLDADKLRHLDGAIDLLVVSFSSIDPAVYRRVHVNLDHARVMANIQAAQKLLRHTRLAISLTPLPECLPSLPATIDWLRAQGVATLTMSPTLYNRGGGLHAEAPAAGTETLRATIRRHRLRSQEFDFIPSIRDLYRQWRSNRFRCLARNVDVFISSAGEYLYCYNDIGHRHVLGNVATHSIDTVLAERERMAPIPTLCDGCNMRRRYGALEVLKTGAAFARTRLAAARGT